MILDEDILANSRRKIAERWCTGCKFSTSVKPEDADKFLRTNTNKHRKIYDGNQNRHDIC